MLIQICRAADRAVATTLCLIIKVVGLVEHPAVDIVTHASLSILGSRMLICEGEYKAFIAYPTLKHALNSLYTRMGKLQELRFSKSFLLGFLFFYI